jgi:hypothetical protein
VVISSLGRLVTEEVDGAVCDSIGLLRLALQVPQAVRLIPTCGEDVERELASN